MQNLVVPIANGDFANKGSHVEENENEDSRRVAKLRVRSAAHGFAFDRNRTEDSIARLRFQVAE
jgi:hypothetical protein